jgi:trehalose 6-phosphate synthase/phosphatase
MSKTIIVSNRLPIRITEENNKLTFLQSEGGLATGLGSIYQEGKNIWIGWPGMTIEDPLQDEISSTLEKMSLVPVFLDDKEIKGYYEGFSNELLWPIFHYTSTYAHYDPESWDMYVHVNKKFRDIILEHLEPGDTLWIHDYQLLLLPGLIRAEQPDVTIAFFQHIPFPSQEIFRLIPWRKELLRGMLGADLIGFHTFDDVRHFISAATHLLSIKVDANLLMVGNRPVAAEPFPMGIDCQKFSELSDDPKVIKEIESLKEHYEGKKLILSIDRLDYSKGIIQRLEAYELFLQENPQYHYKIVFYMIIVPSRDTVPEYLRLKNEIDRLGGNINSNNRSFYWNPIAYFYKGFPIETLSALYNIADVCLISSLRDGMNLVSKEYVASRNDNKGVLILSEMAGASKELIDAIIVNPTNISEVKEAIVEALKMPEEDVMERMRAMRLMVFKFNIHHWVKIFMNRLEEIKQIQKSMKAKSLKSGVKSEVLNAYQKAKNRLLILDYDGTLVGFKKQIEQASPDEELYQVLDQLGNNSKNHLAIISGRNHETMENWFGSKKYNLIAEHGAWTKRNQEWEHIPGLSNAWKEEVHLLMDAFSDRTPGSFVEEKSYSLVWHYRNVQKGLGALRGNELMDNLRYMIAPHVLQLLSGNKVIEVKNTEVNKGKATLKLIDQEEYDFILAIGDDYTDEDIFKALPDEAISIKVGTDLSAARYFVEDYKEVRALLDEISKLP